jgi:subfamily B ATP-binding cassette protein MsbA
VIGFLRLLRLARPHRQRVLVALIAMAVDAAASAGLVLVIRKIFADVLPTGRGIDLVMAVIVGTYLIKGVAAYASNILMTGVGQQVVKDLRDRLFRHMLDQSASFFARRSTGQLVSRLTNDVAQVQRAVSETTGDLIRESLRLVGYAGLLFYLDRGLAIVCITGVPLVIYPLRRLGSRVRSTTRRSQEELEHLTHVAAEAFSGHRIVKAFGAEGREADRFAHASSRLYRTYMRVTRALAALPPLMEFIGGIAICGVLWYAARRIPAQAMTSADLLAFLFAAMSMYAPIKSLSSANASIQQALAASDRIFEMLETHTEVREKPGARPLVRLAESVEFKGVGFAYDDSPAQHILQGVSFRVRAGQVVAIVGLSGAGKTTLVNLIPRFYDVTEGAILIDGVDVRDVTLRSLRDQLALVTQDTVLFDDTIAANIAYGVPGASRDAVEAAARAAHAHAFIAELAGGYDATIGERGQRLSGGQRQRLAIARALLKDSPLLILDEATSSLDAESEALVQDALANLMRNRTTFVIAHRLSTVRRADLVIALDKGRIVEMGTHDQLVNQSDGVYARLYALQMFDERDRDAVAEGRCAGEGES